MAIGQIENGLMGQLFGMIGTGAPLEDNDFVGINDVKITDPTVRDPIHVALDELGKFLVIFAGAQATKI